MEKKSSDNTGFNSKYRWIILAALLMLAFIAAFPQYQMQPMANVIKDTLSLNDSQYSALFTAAYTPAIFISLICGMIVDRFGGRWPIFITMVIAVFGLWGRVFATSFVLLYICNFVLGFPVTFGNSSNAKMLGAWFTPAQCSVCIGVYMAFSTLGTSLATATTPFLPSLRAAYILSAALLTFITLFWLLFYRDRKEPAAVQEKSAEKSVETKKEGTLRKLSVVLHQRDIIIAAVADMLIFGGLQALSAFLGIILMDKGMSETQAGVISALISFGMFFGNLIIPQVIQRVKGLRRTLVIFGVVGALIMMSVSVLPNSIFLYIALLVSGLCIGGCIPVIVSIPLRLENIGVERTGTAGGLIATGQLCGAVIFPTYVVSRIANGNYPFLVILAACCSLIGVILLGFLSRKVETQNA